MLENLNLRGAAYRAGETYDVIQDHADIIVGSGLGALIPEPEAEAAVSTGEGNGAADRDAVDNTVLAQAEAAAEEVPAVEALAADAGGAVMAEAESVAASADAAPEEAPAADEGAAPV